MLNVLISWVFNGPFKYKNIESFAPFPPQAIMDFVGNCT